MGRLALIFIPLILPTLAGASTYQFDLSDGTDFDASQSSGIWDVSVSRLRATKDTNITTTSTYEPINLGNGTDGVFSDGPTQTGITVVSGTAITVDTDVKSEYQFTSFNLSSGVTLTVVGSKPLVIRVLGTVVVGGTLSADGASASANTVDRTGATGNDGSGASGGTGGLASSLQGGTAGSALSTASLAGAGGTYTAAAFQAAGGGGGCNGSDVGDTTEGSDANEAASGSGGAGKGARGQCTSTWPQVAASFKSLFAAGAAGGAGGGGGGAYTTSYSGSGAGAGGGAVQISSLGALMITSTGSVSAKGGNGGNTTNWDGGGTCPGGGGGGAGGSIWLQSFTSVTVQAGGKVNVTGGSAGTDLCAGGYAGGKGSRGVYRVDTGTYSANATDILPTGGTVATNLNYGADYRNVGYVVRSRWINFSDGLWSFSNATHTDDTSVQCGSAGTTAVTYEGSNDGSTVLSEVAESAIADLKDYSYIRLKATFTPTGPGVNPPCLSAVSFDYGLQQVSNIPLSGGAFFCGRIAPIYRQGAKATYGMVLLFVLLSYGFFRTGAFPHRGKSSPSCKSTQGASTFQGH